MTARILRRPKAAQDAEDIADYIAKDSLEAAIRFLENTELTLAKLGASPGSGAPLGELSLRRYYGRPSPNEASHLPELALQGRWPQICRWPAASLASQPRAL